VVARLIDAEPSPQRVAAAAEAPSGAPKAWTSAAAFRLLLLPPFGFLALFFVWPLLWVVFRSVSEPAWGFGNYRYILSQGPYLQVIWITVHTAFTVTLVCLLIAYPTAYFIAHARRSVAALGYALVLIPLWTSVIIRTYAWIVIFQRQGVLNGVLEWAGATSGPIQFIPGSLGVHIGMVHILLPFMLLPILASMRRIDATLLRAGEVLGARPFQLFVHVFAPMTLPGVSAGVAMVFITALGFFVTPALLGGPKHMMAAVLIEQQASQQLNWSLASTLATALLLVTTGLYLLYARLLQRHGLAPGGA
jgi:putative spermidine/putrescine transport system permease protein/mannopine transport system permease protein